MKRIAGCVAVLAALIAGSTGCGGGGTPDTPDGVANKMISMMEDVAKIMEGVTDVKSAQAAKPKLEKISTEAKALQAKMETFEESMTDEEKDAMEAKYAPRVEKIMEKMMPVMMKLMSNPEIMEIFEDLDMGMM